MSKVFAFLLMTLAATMMSGVVQADFSIGNEPAVRGWALVQEGPSVLYNRDVTLGDTLPGNITLAEVPYHPQYGFVILNTERVIVDTNTRKVLAVY